MQIDNIDSDVLKQIFRRLDSLEQQAPAGNTSVTEGAFQVLSAAGFYVGGLASAIVDGLLRVTGVLDVIGTLNVSGSNNVTGTTTQDGPLKVNGNSTFVGDETHAGTLGYTGAETHKGAERHEGDLTYVGGETHVGPQRIVGNITQDGTTTLNGAIIIEGPNPMVLSNGELTSGGARFGYGGGQMEMQYGSSRIAVTPFGAGITGSDSGSVFVSSIGQVRISGRVYLLDLPAKP